MHSFLTKPLVVDNFPTSSQTKMQKLGIQIIALFKSEAKPPFWSPVLNKFPTISHKPFCIYNLLIFSWVMVILEIFSENKLRRFEQRG